MPQSPARPDQNRGKKIEASGYLSMNTGAWLPRRSAGRGQFDLAEFCESSQRTALFVSRNRYAAMMQSR
jgi:hypothetical protein